MSTPMERTAVSPPRLGSTVAGVLYLLISILALFAEAFIRAATSNAF